jgi:D-alanyl-D-alanine carboxypeptidase
MQNQDPESLSGSRTDRPTSGGPRRARRRTLGSASAVVAAASVLAGGGVAAMAGPAAAAGSASASSSTPVPAARAELRFVADRVLASGAPGYVARVDDGRRVTDVATGLADRATRRALRADDQFEIGSTTKAFTATLMLQLEACGRLSLDDSVAKHLPGLVPGGEHITIRMLLQHTSGLFNYTADPSFLQTSAQHPEQMFTPDQLVALAMKHQPDFAPGTSWNYSNTNYLLAGMIVERVSGRPLAELVQQRIARPLGLRRTFLVRSVAPHTGPGYAHGYAVHFTGPKPVYQDMSGNAIGGWGGAAGAVVSTPEELARFFSGLMAGKLLPAAQLREMKHTVPLPRQFPVPGGYGLGLMQVNARCGTVWGHGGDTLGHHSTAVVSEDGHRTAITDTNAEPSDVDGPVPGAMRFAKVAFAAEDASVCVMLRKPLPASVVKDLSAR